ncbi:unnamed protein product [Pylaiella littoralis]
MFSGLLDIEHTKEGEVMSHEDVASKAGRKAREWARLTNGGFVTRNARAFQDKSDPRPDGKTQCLATQVDVPIVPLLRHTRLRQASDFFLGISRAHMTTFVFSAICISDCSSKPTRFLISTI